jgi:hypothetical protein
VSWPAAPPVVRAYLDQLVRGEASRASGQDAVRFGLLAETLEAMAAENR